MSYVDVLERQNDSRTFAKAAILNKREGHFERFLRSGILSLSDSKTGDFLSMQEYPINAYFDYFHNSSDQLKTSVILAKAIGVIIIAVSKGYRSIGTNPSEDDGLFLDFTKDNQYISFEIFKDEIIVLKKVGTQPSQVIEATFDQAREIFD